MAEVLRVRLSESLQFRTSSDRADAQKPPASRRRAPARDSLPHFHTPSRPSGRRSRHQPPDEISTSTTETLPRPPESGPPPASRPPCPAGALAALPALRGRLLTVRRVRRARARAKDAVPHVCTSCASCFGRARARAQTAQPGHVRRGPCGGRQARAVIDRHGPIRRGLLRTCASARRPRARHRQADSAAAAASRALIATCRGLLRQLRVIPY